MREFLRGWRRKAGIASLIFALVFFGLYIRSFGKLRLIQIPTGRFTSYWLSAWDSKLWWGSTLPHGEMSLPPDWNLIFDENVEVSLEYLITKEFEKESEIKWEWKALGFGVGHFERDPSMRQCGFRLSLWMLPCWAFVIPLTIISAYLMIPSRTAAKKQAS